MFADQGDVHIDDPPAALCRQFGGVEQELI